MLRLLLLLTLSAAFVGCGEAKKKLPVRFPVSGSVTYNGQPPKGATVQLEPTTPPADGVRVPKPGATVQADGSFKISSYETADGAPPGEYSILIWWDNDGSGGPSGDDVFQGRYRNMPVSKVTVSSGENAIPPLQLTGPPVSPPGSRF